MTIKRLAVVNCTLVVLAFLLLCRVYWVGICTQYAASAASQSVSTVALPRHRGNFYDRNGLPLTGTQKSWYALCVPGDSSYVTLFPFVPYEQQQSLYRMRNHAAPFLIEVAQDLTVGGVYTVEGERRYLPLPIAPHLIGYLDGEGHGVSGLERAYDDLLYRAGETAELSCATTASGTLMAGAQPTRKVTAQGNRQGVALTLDASLQRACEGIAQAGMPRGCILVLDVSSGEILASVSMPDFDPDRVADSIAAGDTSLIDRPYAPFSAGSVFKVVLAAAAYGRGLDWYTWDCVGSTVLDGQTYRCALGRAHGTVNLRGALEQSCNCYFVALGQQLGAAALLDKAGQFGFGSPTALAPGLKSAAGQLPTLEELQASGQLALFSFGQGTLTATPLQIAAMMNVVASGGWYLPPRLVRGICDEATGAVTPAEQPAPRRVCNADTARVLRSMLVSVVEDGIGRAAKPLDGGAGGKTGTAQTGQYNADGKELLNYWFAGFYPADSPRFVITVLQDAALEPETPSAALFAQVANALDAQTAAETAPP